MTVNTISSVAEFDTNGVTTNYPFYFKFLANEDLVVTYVDPNGVSLVMTYGTDYTVNGAGKDDGGSIVTSTALPGPGQLVVSRDMEAFQQTSLRNQGKFLAETHEDVFDKLTMLIQQGFSLFRRALVRPLGRDYYDAENRRIANVRDPVELQDAATKNWAQQYIGDIIGSGQGPINSAANVLYQGPDGAPYNLQQLSGLIGSDLVGHRDWDNHVTTVGRQLRLLSNNTIYSDDARFGGNLAAAVAAMGNNTVLVIRQPYILTEPLRIVGKTNPVVLCVGAGKLIGSRTAFTFPTANARGILHFDNCVNPVAYRMNILGARTAKATFGADVKQDGDAGIEYYQCSSPRTIKCKVNEVLTWGIIHIGCTDTKAIDNILTNMTRQSGIGHATVAGGLCRGNFVNYAGLYGIEVEGPGNTDITVHKNKVRNCLAGVAVIGSINSCEVKENTISLCTYLIQLDTNGAENSQVGVEISGNRTYDGRFYFYLKDTTFVDIVGNTSLGRVADAYLPQRPADHVVSVISSTVVLILDSTAGSIVVGDIHYYSEGVSRTVQAVTTQVDAVYGSCWRVTYALANTAIGFGSFFLRYTPLANSGAWMYMTGTRNGNINVSGNSGNTPAAYGLSLNGNMNSLRWGSNRIVGASTAFYAGDNTGITNSSIVCKRGDIQNPGASLFGGNYQAKLLPWMVGETRTVNMGTANRPINLMTNGLSLAFRLRVNVYGSTKTGSTGNALITINGTSVETIPVAAIGTTLIQLDIPVNVLAGSYTLNIADTFGDMTIQSASFELHTIEV